MCIIYQISRKTDFYYGNMLFPYLTASKTNIPAEACIAQVMRVRNQVPLMHRRR